MTKIYLAVFCLFFIGSSIIYSQEKIAKTASGQIILLNEDGTWKVKNNIGLNDNKAVTVDGKLVLLGRDGKWFLTNTKADFPSQRQESNQYVEKKYSSSTGTLIIPYSSATVTGIAYVHVPKSNYAMSRPVMLLLDPGGNAENIVSRWQAASDRFGWIVASTPAIMNGTDTVQITRHLLALLEAIVATWAVDMQAIMLEGFSGGGCAAYRQVIMYPNLFRGAIVECGHMGPFLDLEDQIRPGSIFYLVTRNQDFNAQHMRDLARALVSRGQMVKFVELSGGHSSILGIDADNALEWINSIIR